MQNQCRRRRCNVVFVVVTDSKRKNAMSSCARAQIVRRALQLEATIEHQADPIWPFHKRNEFLLTFEMFMQIRQCSRRSLRVKLVDTNGFALARHTGFMEVTRAHANHT